MLFRWITRRFAFYGKGVEMEAAQRLIYLSGDQMKALIPEIEKIATYARGEKVTAADVNAVATRIAESDIFDLTDAIAERRFNTASGLLADLLEQRDTSGASTRPPDFSRICWSSGTPAFRRFFRCSPISSDGS